MKLIDSRTYENLAKAYSGECQAYVRYKFIEYGARMQEYKTLAQLIDEVVYNEFNHARMFYTFIQKASNKNIENIDICAGYPFKEKWDLTENLKLAAEDEEAEENIYEEYKQIALEEGFDEIAKLFDDTKQVEGLHKKLFLDLYDQMKNNTLYKKDKIVKWKCADCGYEAEGYEPWDECPLCKAKRGSVLLHVSTTFTENEDN